jgi:hypothetical protein
MLSAASQQEINEARCVLSPLRGVESHCSELLAPGDAVRSTRANVLLYWIGNLDSASARPAVPSFSKRGSHWIPPYSPKRNSRRGRWSKTKASKLCAWLSRPGNSQAVFFQHHIGQHC